MADRWHPAPGTRYFRAGDKVRLDGERGRSYRLVTFDDENGKPTATVVAARNGAVRTVYAERLRR